MNPFSSRLWTRSWGRAVVLGWFLALQGTIGIAAPLSPGEHEARLNGLKFWYQVKGNGPVAIFQTPGWGPDSQLYINTFGPLEKRFTIVYVDARGAGRTARPSSVDQYSFQHLVDDIEALRKELGQEKVWVFGHSLGGITAQMYALAHPDRVAGLMLFDTVASYATPEHMRDIDNQYKRIESEPWFGRVMANYAQFSDHGPYETDEEFFKAFDSIQELYVPVPSTLQRYREARYCGTTFSKDSYAAFLHWVSPVDLTPELGKIRVPTVVISGELDVFTSKPMGEAIHRGIEGSRFVSVSNAGHLPFFENPEEMWPKIEEALDSLAK